MFNTKSICQAALIAAIYTALGVIFLPISFGPIQCRVSEMLTVLPAFIPAAVPGVTIGCLITNILGGAILPDVVFGTLATLIGAVLTRALTRNLPEAINSGFSSEVGLKSGFRKDDAVIGILDRHSPETGLCSSFSQDEAANGNYDRHLSGTGLSLSFRLRTVLPPIISNSIIVPLVLKFAYMYDDALYFMFITVAIGEIISIGIAGNILMSVLCKSRVLKTLTLSQG